MHVQVACPAKSEHLNPPRRRRAPVRRTMYKSRARQPLRDFAREHFVCTKARPGIAAFHDRARAPFLRRTSWQTLRNPKAHARATFCDWRDRHTARTRWMYAVLPGTGRPAATSFKSRKRNRRRNQDQYFSTGFSLGSWVALATDSPTRARGPPRSSPRKTRCHRALATAHGVGAC